MAKVKNITPDVLSLFRADAPPINAGDEITVRDENFIGRAWPKSTWDLIEPPVIDGLVDQSTDEHWLYDEPAPAEPGTYDPGEHPVDEVLAYLSDAIDDERARVIAAEAAGKARKTITEWSDR